MERFGEAAKLLLERAARDFSEGKYASCVLRIRDAAEYALKGCLLSAGKEVKFKSLLDAAKELRALSILSEEELSAIALLNDLANKVQQEGYSPKRAEVLGLAAEVGKAVRKMLKRA